MTLLDAAKSLRGTLRDGISANEVGSSEAKPRMADGVAVTDSVGGFVTIRLDNAPTDGSADFEVACESPIVAGNRVTYTSIEGKGKATSVENLALLAENADTAASEAQAVANAVNQHFWDDANGAHVTEVEQDSWNDPTSTDYHTGRDITLNSNGILLRKDYNTLASFTPSAVAFYDGQGNAASNVVASFGANGATIGKTSSANVGITDRKVSVRGNGSDLVSLGPITYHSGQFTGGGLITFAEGSGHPSYIYGTDYGAIEITASTGGGHAFLRGYSSSTSVGDYSAMDIRVSGDDGDHELGGLYIYSDRILGSQSTEQVEVLHLDYEGRVKVGDVGGTLENLGIAYRDFDIAVNYSAGTVGTRGMIGSAVCTWSGHVAVAATAVYVSASANYNPHVWLEGNRVYVAAYRASTSAVSNGNVTCRVLYIGS